MTSIIDRLREDLRKAEGELAEAENQLKPLRWKVEYIRTLLASDNDATNDAVSPRTRARLPRFMNLDAPAVMQELLTENGGPMRLRELAKAAIDEGYTGGGGDFKVVSASFSSIVSKDEVAKRDRFVRSGAGWWILLAVIRSASL